MTLMDYSVVVPVYDGEKTLRNLTQGIIRELNGHGSYEIIFVFDDGKSSSWAVLKDLENEYPNLVKVFRLDRNYGQHNATLFGISKSEGDSIITMDEDLQHDPVYIKDLISKQREQHSDVVYARFKNLRHSFPRSVASMILRKTLKYLIPGIGYYSSYRLITRRVAVDLLSQKSSYTFIDAGLVTSKARILYLDVDHRQNSSRVSTYNFLKLLSHSLQIMLAYTSVIRWVFMLGVLQTTFAVFLRIYLRSENAIWFLLTGVVLMLFSIKGFIYKKVKIEFNSRPLILHEAN